MSQTLEHIDQCITGGGSPKYFITANLNYVMLCERNDRLKEINEKASFILADGKPIVWATRFRKKKLPERVAGADLIPLLCAHAAEKKYRLYFLGGAPGTAEIAAQKMKEKYPGLEIAGIECPPFRQLTEEEHLAQLERIRQSNTHLLFVAFGQPKGEYWMSENLAQTGVPLAVQIGGTFYFMSGRLARAPRWMQKVGLEWLFRWLQEPRRLGGRYISNIFFICKMLFRDVFGLNKGK
jgi:N-acetylglucosaminyldiphosphoundecaprenol N-acetyl-beta-D-mannosaminyltransferase